VNSDLEAFVCQDFKGLGDLGAISYAATEMVNAAQERYKSASAEAKQYGVLNQYALNIQRAGDIVSSMTAILTFLGDPSRFCLVPKGTLFAATWRTQGATCITFLGPAQYEEELRKETGLLDQVLRPVELAVNKVAAPSIFGTNLLSLLTSPIKALTSGEEDVEPSSSVPVTTATKGTAPMAATMITTPVPIFSSLFSSQPAQTPSADVGGEMGTGFCEGYPLAGRTSPDPVLYASDKNYQYCWDEYKKTAAYTALLKSNPEAITTPQPGLTPVGVPTGEIVSSILQSLTAGWNAVQTARMQAELMKAMKQKKPVYLTQGQIQQARTGPSWGLIAGGGVALILGGVLIYLLMSKKQGGGTAASVASVTPKLVPAKAGAK